MSDFVFDRTPPSDGPPPPPNPATEFFVKRLKECYKKVPVRDPSTGQVVMMNSNRLAKFMNDYLSDDDERTLATNTCYRLQRGETSPRIDMVYRIAKAFGVPPSSFLPDQIVD